MLEISGWGNVDEGGSTGNNQEHPSLKPKEQNVWCGGKLGQIGKKTRFRG